jgi:ParB-like chromosome segregation protein Spo0J
MKVEMRAITQIKPYENNPRSNDAAVDAVAKSIKEFGFRQPIVVDENDVIIVGHTRYKTALIPAGFESVWAVLHPGDYLGEGAPSSHAQGLHGKSRMVFLWLA